MPSKRMRCKECNDPLPVPAGGYVVIESEIRNGIGLAIIKADGFDQDACEDDRICCALCLGNYVGKKLRAALTERRPVISVRHSA